MKARFVFIALLLSVFLLSLSTGCKEERKRDRHEKSERTREFDDPIVKEMEEWADGACACDDIECVTKAGNNLLAMGYKMEDKKVTRGEFDKVEASIARATKCIEDGTAKYAANARGGDDSGGLTGGQQYKLQSAQKKITEIKGKLSKGEEVRGIDCLSINAVIKDMASLDNADVKAVIEEGGQLCSHDAPLARVTAWKKEVEAGAAKGGFNSACFSVHKKTLAELTTAYPTDVAVTDINTYIQATCAKK